MNGDWLILGAVAALALAGSRRGSRANLSSLDLVEYVELPAFGRQPVRWATGAPVIFDYSHNTEPSPYYGARYGQDLEPAGRYVVTYTLDPKHRLPGHHYGTIRFVNPVVLASVWPVEGQYGGAEGWKHKLSAAFGGKRGLALTRALITAGYDGIVTITLPGAHSSQGPYLSEIVELGVMSRQRPRGSPSLVRQVQSHLSPDLLDPSRKGTGRGPQGGHCYVASQALWHLLGGKRSGYTPQVGPAPGGGTHWWLRQDRTGRVLDPTASQFPRYDYNQGTGKGFQTQKPSKRAAVLIDRVQRGSRSAPRLHAMKLDPWVQRLVAGINELASAMQAADPARVIDGIDDVSFWTGRVVCDLLGAAEHGEASESELQVAGAQLMRGQQIVMQAKTWLKARGSTNAAGLPYSAYFGTAAYCGLSGPYVYPWKKGDPIPDDEDLMDHAEKSWKPSDCDWTILDASELDWDGVEPEFELRPTLAGTKVVLK